MTARFFWNSSERGVSSEIKVREGLDLANVLEATHAFAENICAEDRGHAAEGLQLMFSRPELTSHGGIVASIGIPPPRHAFAEPFRGFVSGESDWWIVRSFREGGSFFVQGFLVNKNKFLSVINSEISEIGFVAPPSHALGDASFLCEGLPIFIRGNANFGGVPMSMRVLFSKKGEAVSVEELLFRVWNASPAELDGSRIASLVSRLRKKLSDVATIRPVARGGYVLVV